MDKLLHISCFQVYKKYFPDIAIGYKDPRVKLHVIDGIYSASKDILFIMSFLLL